MDKPTSGTAGWVGKAAAIGGTLAILERVAGWASGATLDDFSRALERATTLLSFGLADMSNLDRWHLVGDAGALVGFVCGLAWLAMTWRGRRAKTIAPATESPQVDHVREALRKLAASIPIPRTPTTGMEATLAVASRALFSHVANTSEEIRDWRTETRAATRALLKPALAADYERELRSKSPELACRRFLESLAQHLLASDLRA